MILSMPECELNLSGIEVEMPRHLRQPLLIGRFMPSPQINHRFFTQISRMFYYNGNRSILIEFQIFLPDVSKPSNAGVVNY